MENLRDSNWTLASVVEPERQKPHLFALAEPKPESIPVPEPDLDPDLT